MKNLFLTILLSALIFNLNAQPWKQYFEASKNSEKITLDDYRQAFNKWVEAENIVDGKILVNGKWEKAPGYKQFKRWEYYWESRVNNKDNSFPTTSAYEEYQKYRKTKDGEVWAGNWTSMGPSYCPGGYNGLGRVNCIEFHPSNDDIFWIGTPSGGLWQTSDGGNSWIPLTDKNGVLGVSDIAISKDFETSKTMYIATGDRDGGSLWALGGDNQNDNNSIGVLKTTDGGKTWNETGLKFAPKDCEVIGRLLIDPKNEKVLIAGTTDGIYRSEDAGETWTRTYKNYYAISMEFHPTNSDIIYATNANSYVRILKSIDNGVTFEEVYSEYGTIRGEISVSPAQPDLVYVAMAKGSGALNGIYKSTDAGDNFTKEFDGSSSNGNLLGYSYSGSDDKGQGSYDLCIASSLTDAKEVFIGGINTWKSKNSGSKWDISSAWSSYGAPYGVDIVHADKHLLKYRPSDNALFEGNDGGVYKTTDNGKTWKHLSNGLEITQIYRFGLSATDSDMVIIGNQDNGSKLLSNNNWRDVKGGDGMECIIDYTNPKIQYATYVNGQITRTNDGWTSSYNTQDISAKIPGGNNGAWVTPYIIDPINHETLYVGYDKLWKTTNKGNTWTRLGNISSTSKFRSMAICQSNNQVMLVADYNNIYKTFDGGKNWTKSNNGINSNINKTNVAIHNDNPMIMWTTMGGYTKTRVYQSTDGGDNWVDISNGLPEVPVYSLVHNKLQTNHLELYIATELGVWMKSGDNDWIQYTKGLPNVVVSELEIFYGDDIESSRLRAATFGRGLWESNLFYLNSDFSATPTSGVAPLEVKFKNQSINANSYFWKLGDGTSRETNPTHIYEKEGVYDILLIAYNDTDNSELEKTNYINVKSNGIEITSKSPFNIYPNPGNGIFTINGTDKYTGQKVDIKVLKSNGKTIRTIPMTFGNKNTIDLTGEASGIYYLSFQLENKTMMNKIIIQ